MANTASISKRWQRAVRLAKESGDLDALTGGRTMPLPTRLTLERILAGLSVPQCARAMAAMTGVSWSHTLWHRVERGERDLSGFERRCAAKILGVTCKRIAGAQPTAVIGWKKRGRRAKAEKGVGVSA